MYVLDTNVVSELRRARPHGAVLAWLDGVANPDLYVSAVTIGEVQVGIEATRQQDPARAAAIESWLEDLMEAFDVLAPDARAYRVWARLMHRRDPEVTMDALIAATALAHGFTVVTRNVRDFAPFGVPLLNPFEAR